MDLMMTETESGVAPRGGLTSVDGRAYPLEGAHLEGRAEGGLAFTTLRQRFLNPWAEALEVEYTLPLPADGAVLGYVVTVGERRIVGEVQTREVAERTYRDALYEGRTAGLLEQDRADTFQQRLGNIPAGTPVEVEISVLHPLAFTPADEEGAGAGWEYRFPTVVGVRYMGAEGRVPDARRLSPDREAGGLPARLTLDLAIPDAPGAEGVESATHPIRVEAGRVSLAAGAALDRDLVVRWPAPAPGVGVRVVEGGGLEGDNGRYALVTVLPPEVPARTVQRDLTILLDSSGSMEGVPLALAKQVVATLLLSLRTGDRFELLSFGSRVEDLVGGACRVDANTLRRALECLDAVEARGGTEMRQAVARALNPLRPDAQRQVVLVTDGYIGFEGEVVAEAMRALPAGVRFHAVGVGAAPNRTLTGGLARAGRGVEVFALDEASARVAAGRLVAATARPILTGLTVGGSAVHASAPARPRDIMAGQPAVLTVELAPGGGTLELSGVLAGEGPWRRVVDLPAWKGDHVARGGTPLPLGALHGRETVADLELEEAAGASRQEIDSGIERVALRHRIVSRRTSLVAVAEEPSVDPRLPRRRERLAVELPAGVSAQGVEFPVSPSPGGRMRTARAAFEAAPMMANLDGSYDHEALMDLAMPAESPSIRAPRPWDLLKKVGGGGPGSEVTAEVIRRDGNLLVVEFDVPSHGFELPVGTVTVILEDGRRVQAVVEPGESTARGPWNAGVRVRLGLRSHEGAPWAGTTQVTLRWGGRNV